LKGGGASHEEKAKKQKGKRYLCGEKEQGTRKRTTEGPSSSVGCWGGRGHGGHQSLKGGSGVVAALHEVGFRGGGGTQAFTRIFYHIGLLIGRRVAKAWNYFWPKTIIVFYL
jgi:hypothetical protein